MRISDISTSEKPYSFWITGAATTIAVRSSDITNVIGPISSHTIHQRNRPVFIFPHPLCGGYYGGAAATVKAARLCPEPA